MAFEIRRAKDEAALREKLPRRLADRLIEIEKLEEEENEEREISALPIGTEVILPSGAHGFVFEHFRREDGTTDLFITSPDYWAQRRKWDQINVYPESWKFPPEWNVLHQSEVTVVTTPENG